MEKVVVTFFITLISCNLLGKGFVYIHQHFDVPAITATLHHYLHPLRDILIACIVTGTCYLDHQNQRSRRMLLENEQLRSENLVNQYEALKSQLNPHMLFNSLNTLYSLIRESPNKAQNYLQELSRVMRYTLHDNLSHTVTLNEEMSFVRSYIYLLQMRYEDNLKFDIDIPQELSQRQVPPMAIQLLVENAVKHNEISNRNPFTIRIYAENNKLCVSNRIQPKLSDSSSTCIGLANLSKRYRLLFGQDITIEENEKTFKSNLTPYMKTLIIEDEKAALRNLKAAMKEVDIQFDIIGETDSVTGTLEWFASHPMPELVLWISTWPTVQLSAFLIIQILLAPLSLRQLTMNMLFRRFV